MIGDCIRSRFKLLTAKTIAFTLTIFMAAIALFAFAPVAKAVTTSTPQKINFQGRLTDSSGNIVANGLYNMKFALYDAASAGTLKWNETRETTNRVQVTGGLFTVQLGSVNAFTDPTIFSTGSLYFEITLANPATATCSTASCQTWEAAMSRSQLATSAYAFNSDTLDGIDSTGFIQNQTGSSQAASFKINGAGTAANLNATTGITLGTASTTTGTMTINNGTNANTVTLQSGVTATTYTLTLPTAVGSTGQCLAETTGTGTLGWGACSAGGVSLAGNNVWTGTNTYRTTSATALLIQNAGGAATLLTANTSTMNLALGASASLTLTGGATGTRPASPTEGMVYYDTTTKQLLTYSNAKWQADRTTSTEIVAASDSTQAAKDAADYVVSGAADDEITAAATAAAGGTVFLMPGTYTIDNALYPPAGTTLAGSGYSTLVRLGVHPAATGYDSILGGNSGPYDTTVRDIRFDGQKSLQTCAGACTQSAYYAWQTGNGTNQGPKFINNWFMNFKDDGLYLASSENVSVIGNTFMYNDRSGVNAGSNNILSSNVFQNNGEGVRIGYSGQVAVTGNTFVSNTTGVYLYQSNNVTVSGNGMYSNTTGVFFDATSVNNTITGNTMNGNTGAGVEFNGADSNTVTGNTISSTSGTTDNDAILLNYGSSNNTISDNNITDDSCTVTCRAIYIADSASTDNYLANNYFTSTPGTSVITDAGTTTVYASQPIAEKGRNTLFKQANSATAFQVQRADSTSLFTVDTSANKVQIGSSTADNVAVVFVVDSYNQAADPGAVVGGMYYNTLAGRFRCYEGSAWVNCTGPQYATASPAQAFTAGTPAYVTGSVVTIPSTGLRQGATITWRVVLSKTAAGTVAGTIAIYSGTSGTVPASDTSRQSFGTGTPTAVIDTAVYTITAYVSAGGASTVLWSNFAMTHNTANTGFSNTAGLAAYGTSASFNSTTNTKIGLVMNTGTASVVTVQQVQVQTSNL